MRDNVTLQCGDCKRRNYVTTKNKKKTTGRGGKVTGWGDKVITVMKAAGKPASGG